MRKNKWIKLVFRRRALVILTLLFQIAFIIFIIAGARRYLYFSYWVLYILSIVVCISVLNKHEKPGYKITWIFIILLFPIFGGILFIILNFWSNPKKFRKAIDQNINDSRDAFYLAGNKL
jgi:cardiolipin synthase